MEFKLISIASIIAFYGCYFVKMFHQKKQGIQTEQIGKNKVGFVKTGVSKTDKTELVTNGIYQISRNPAFLGFDLLYIGTLLMFFNWILCFLTVFAVIMYHLQIVNWDNVIGHGSEIFHNPQESGLDRMLRFMLYQNQF